MSVNPKKGWRLPTFEQSLTVLSLVVAIFFFTMILLVLPSCVESYSKSSADSPPSKYPRGGSR